MENFLKLLMTTGCPKSSFLYFISLYFSTIGLGKQIIETKVASFNLITLFELVAPSFDSDIRFVYFHAKGARARVYLPAFFLYFIAQIALTSLLPCFL